MLSEYDIYVHPVIAYLESYIVPEYGNTIIFLRGVDKILYYSLGVLDMQYCNAFLTI